jgi:hypothetical protein
MNVSCPICKKQAEWLAAPGADDDIGALVCRNCGATLPAFAFPTCRKRTSPDDAEPVEGEGCSQARLNIFEAFFKSLGIP